jgi:hypothetical protein
MDLPRVILSSISPHWALIVIVSALGIGAASVKAFESDESKTRRAQQKKRKDLQALAESISRYGESIHQQFPSGNVVVSERDLAEHLRKRPEAVASALNLLLIEQKVQRAPLSGYWKLNT